MSWSMTLNYGEAFAEVMIRQGNEARYKRWFLPGLKFSRALSTWLKSLNVERLESVRLSTRWVQTILDRRLYAQPAFITTQGFEHLLDLTERARTLSARERVNAQGHIEIRPQADDLGHLYEKLKLMKIETVALGFLHSKKNPENEKYVAEFLTAQGLSVFCSSQRTDDTGEVTRWSRTIEHACVQTLYSSWISELVDVCSEFHCTRENIFVLTDHGFHSVDTSYDPMTTARGPQHAVARFAQQQNYSQTFTYFGLEEFFDQNQGLLLLQPLQTLVTDALLNPGFSKQSIQYETGPMGWGRGLMATPLDIAWQTTGISEPEEFAQRFLERGRKRLFETLMTLTRPLSGVERSTPEALILNLKREMSDAFAELSNKVCIGPLARTFADFMPTPHHVPIESTEFAMCLGLGGQA